MLNTRYIKTTDPNNPVVKRASALGNAWFVSTITHINSPDEELASLTSFSPQKEAIVDDSKFKLNKDTYSNNGSITLTNYSPKHMTYESNSDDDGFAVFSEVYYKKGWVAYIDGKELDHIRVNYILRGLEIPKGKHKVEFKFDPQSYTVGNRIALITSILVISSFLLGIVLSFKSKEE